MGLAIDLAIQGMSSIVVERLIIEFRGFQGQNLTPRISEHFRRWGVSDDIRAASPIPHNYANGGMASYRTFASDHFYDWFNDLKLQIITLRQMSGFLNMRLRQYCGSEQARLMR